MYALSTIAKKLPVADHQAAVVDPSILRESAQVDIPQNLIGYITVIFPVHTTQSRQTLPDILCEPKSFTITHVLGPYDKLFDIIQ
jgi:hypothetical protein